MDCLSNCKKNRIDNVTDNMSENMATREAIASKNKCVEQAYKQLQRPCGVKK